MRKSGRGKDKQWKCETGTDFHFCDFVFLLNFLLFISRKCVVLFCFVLVLVFV